MFEQIASLLGPLAGLGLVGLAAKDIGAAFRRLRLPLISGFLVCGALAGPHVLGLLSSDAVGRLVFVDEIAIAFIAFAAGSELYLKEFRDRLRSILWVTAGTTVVTFAAGVAAFVWLAPQVPGIGEQGTRVIFAAALMAGSILVARSPSSAIAVIKELRAWGPFTRTGLGVTVIMDALVIVLFTISAEIADALVTDLGVRLQTGLLLAVELGLSVVAGFVVAQVLRLVLAGPGDRWLKSVAVLAIGYGVYAGAAWARAASLAAGGYEVLVEPLLICMIAGLVVANMTPYRGAFMAIIEKSSPFVFTIFFTLTGASLSFDVLATAWKVALVLFLVRMAAIVVGSTAGGVIAGEPAGVNRLLWMSFITQAGVGLGLAKNVAYDFPEWGGVLATVVIAVIVLNQLVGPPLYKWALKAVGEAHPRADAAGFDGVRDVIIFGQEGQAMALAHQLHANGWHVKLAVRGTERFEDPGERGLELHRIEAVDLDTFEALEAARAECIVALLDDDSNYRVCEIAYESYGTGNVVVRINDSSEAERFHALGALAVDPRTAMITLLDHLVRSPSSTSLLLGLESGRSVAEIHVGNPNLDGVELRRLQLPEEALVISLRRGSHSLITRGSTHLRVGDWVTVFGTEESIREVAVRFEG